MSLLNVISVIAVILHLWASHAHKIKSASNYRAFYLILGLWNENCLTNQKLLRYQIFLDMSKSIFDLFISLFLHSLTFGWHHPKSLFVSKLSESKRNDKEIDDRRNQAKNSQNDGQTCWMNFVNFEAAKKIEVKNPSAERRMMMVNMSLYRVVFLLASFSYNSYRSTYCCLHYYFP